MRRSWKESAAIVGVCAIMCVQVGFIIGVVYVAYHFISKYW